MVGERIRSLWGDNGTEERLDPDPEADEFESPEQVENPHTLEDSTNTRLRDWISENSTFVLSMSLLLMAGLILLTIYAGRFFVTFFTNPWVQRIAVGSTIAIGAYLQGNAAQRSRIKDEDMLVLYDPDAGKVTTFLGEFRTAEGSTFDKFVPHKGFRGFMHTPEEYRIGELSQALVRKHGYDPNATAEIRLHPELMGTRPAEYGRVVIQVSSGLEPDPHSEETNLVAEIPEMASQSTVSDMKEQVTKLDDERQHLQNKITQLIRQRNDARQEAQKARERVRKDIGETAAIFEPFVTRSGSSNNEENGEKSTADKLLNGIQNE